MAPSSKNIYPSKIEPLTFPVFGISWFIEPNTGRSIVAYSGGGGSARTGVFNSIVIQDTKYMNDTGEPIAISTKEQIGVAIRIYQNPISKNIFVLVAMNQEIYRYTIPPPPVVDGEKYSNAIPDILQVCSSSSSTSGSRTGTTCNAIAVNVMATQLAVGCEDGVIYIYDIMDDILFTTITKPKCICLGHTAAVCSVAFSLRNNKLITSAKDGTARVWDTMTGKCISTLECNVPLDVETPNNKKKKSPKPVNSNKPQQVLVRGCSFADIQGQVAIAVASTRRGKAYLFQWIEQKQPVPPNNEQQEDNIDNNTNKNNSEIIYTCTQLTECSVNPISAMSLSEDGLLLALGSVNGSITLWDMNEWKALRTFTEIHDLPVTCIAARPYAIPLVQGEEEFYDSVPIHVRSASADSKLACLTLQRYSPKKKQRDGYGTNSFSISGWIIWFITFIYRLMYWMIVLWVLRPVGHELWMKCGNKLRDKDNTMHLEAFRQCFMNEFLIAPPSHPGISSPFY